MKHHDITKVEVSLGRTNSTANWNYPQWNEFSKEVPRGFGVMPRPGCFWLVCLQNLVKQSSETQAACRSASSFSRVWFQQAYNIPILSYFIAIYPNPVNRTSIWPLEQFSDVDSMDLDLGLSSKTCGSCLGWSGQQLAQSYKWRVTTKMWQKNVANHPLSVTIPSWQMCHQHPPTIIYLDWYCRLWSLRATYET